MKRGNYNLRLDIRGEWLVIPASQHDIWDVENGSLGLIVESGPASDSTCDFIPKSKTVVHPEHRAIYVHSGRVPASAHPAEIWGETSIAIGLSTSTFTADVLFITPFEDMDTDTCIGIAFPEKDDAIRFEEKRDYGFGEHFHGPFNRQQVYGMKIRLSETEPAPSQVRERGNCHSNCIDSKLLERDFWYK